MPRDDKPAAGVSRRIFMAAGAGFGLGAGLASQSALASGQQSRSVATVRSDGTYEVVPLAKDAFTLGVVQSRVIPVDLGNLKQTRRANLDHMLALIDASDNGFSKPDMLLFHEFPITGWRNWSRRETLRVAIEIPGEESEAIAAKAKQHGMYIVFGSYVRDPDWKEHVLSITAVIGPDGRVLDKHWKARNIKGVFGAGKELFTTTIYDVLDRYIEMYGEDAVIPVTRTPIGNFAMGAMQREPEYFRAAAMKGAEVMLRTATGGFSPIDIQATSLYNGVYTAICNNAISRDGPFFEDLNAGGSAIYGPTGEALAAAASPNQTLVSALIPIAQFRARHRQPVIHKELYMREFEQYVPRYAPNLFQDYVASDLEDAARYLKDKGRWK